MASFPPPSHSSLSGLVSRQQKSPSINCRFRESVQKERKDVNLQFRHLQEMGEKEGLNFEVERLIRTLLRGGRWRMAQVRIK